MWTCGVLGTATCALLAADGGGLGAGVTGTASTGAAADGGGAVVSLLAVVAAGRDFDAVALALVAVLALAADLDVVGLLVLVAAPLAVLDLTAISPVVAFVAADLLASCVEADFVDSLAALAVSRAS